MVYIMKMCNTFKKYLETSVSSSEKNERYIFTGLHSCMSREPPPTTQQETLSQNTQQYTTQMQAAHRTNSIK